MDHEVVGLEESETGVAVRLRSGATGNECGRSASQVVGCEGGRSFTRRWTGASSKA